MQTATTTPHLKASLRPLSSPRRAPARVRWTGPESLPECIRCLCAGEMLEIHLPHGYLDGVGLHCGGDGPTLLGTLSRVRGLEPIGLLVLPAQVTHARAQVVPGRPPRLVMAPRSHRGLPGD